MLARVLTALLAAGLASAQLGFRITGDVTECGATEIEWQGGVPPLYITAIPAFHTATNITVDDYANRTTGGRGSFVTPYAAGTEVTFILSDSTGFATGGVSPLYTVGKLKTGDVCQEVTSNPPFQFDMSPSTSHIDQCQDVEFIWNSKKTSSEVYVTGVIPNGQVIQWMDDGGFGRTGWTVNLQEGTNVVFAMWDDAGNQGGTSKLLTVGSGSDTCLNNPYSATPTWTPTSGTLEPTTTTSHKPGVVIVTAITVARPAGAADLSGGAIAGIVIGVVFVVLVAQALVVWFCCRRQLKSFLDNRRQQRERRRNPDVDLFESEEATGMTSLNSFSKLHHSRLPESGSHNPFDDHATTISPFVGGSECPSPVSLHSPVNHSPVGHSPVGHSPINPTHISSHYLTTQASSSSGLSADSERSIIASAGGMSVRVPSPKAQLAAANPDAGALSPVFSDLPSPLAPRGGFRRHQDAGRVNVPTQNEVEDLPPNYNPEWERDRT